MANTRIGILAAKVDNLIAIEERTGDKVKEAIVQFKQSAGQKDVEKSSAMSAKSCGDKVLRRSMETMKEEPRAWNKMQYGEARVSDIEGVQAEKMGNKKERVRTSKTI